MLTMMSVFRAGRDVECQQVDLPDVPGFAALKAVVRPLLNGGEIEHVSVLYQGRRADMFVDEQGFSKRLPRNEEATTIYRANWLSQHAETRPETLPYICGTAVLFYRIVWS